jgi:DNA-binding MarR family transcriptional regulator
MKKEEALRASFQALTEISIIAHLADTALAKTLPHGLSIAGFGVLNHFVRLERDGESPSQLARAFQVTKGAMTYTLQQLEERGLVRIDADPADARGKTVRITAKGRRAREAGVASVQPGMERLITAIGAEEFARALPFLTKLRAILDAARD